MYEVFSSGGGTQSACISALIVQGKLPKPDFMVIADTGRECDTTWQYMDAVVRPAMADIGVDVHRIGPEWQSMPAHGRNYQTHNENTLLIPVFTSQNGDSGKLSGFCSTAWKIEVVNRYLSRTFGITRSKYRKWIGFSLDEWRRAQRMMMGDEYQKGQIRFPLIVDVPLKRHEAIREVERMGWPTPPRSRCWMCPNQADDEWRGLSQDEFAKAVQFEAELQTVDPHAWLHKSCTPLTQVDFEAEPTLFDSGNYCNSGVCFV
ncbi:hypothetical protein KI809_18830 [Geobacter pelophilus]|uniref:3'-phosphoadenosine 5'-phosphosulfate sulfotransferase (PAPS reductase)/FAD synthetase n=1 Tax=Geoanaerobacter pelophilus TaxID=60036 RepID=A0AAW4LB92_9BACT|nr:hypothetical protein [Geoanaerobacter pelophilus]MBT0666368.1 hypothetical protein [Geoanaerobacter pelophilus]